MKRILMMIMCVVMAISLFGCGQSKEEKYMSLRNEVETEMKAYDKIVLGLRDLQKNDPYVPSKERFRAQYLPHHEKALPEMKAIQKRLTSKMDEMGKIAKSDLKLKNDYDKFVVRMSIVNDGVEAESNLIKKYKE